MLIEINTQRPGVGAGLPPDFDQALAIFTLGISDKGSEKTVAKVGGLMCKAGVKREPGRKRAEGTLSQVRESRRNVLARTKGSWKQTRNRKWWQVGGARLVMELGLPQGAGCGGRRFSGWSQWCSSSAVAAKPGWAIDREEMKNFLPVLKRASLTSELWTTV